MRNLIRSSGTRLRASAIRARPYLGIFRRYARQEQASAKAAQVIQSSALFDVAFYRAQTSEPLGNAFDAVTADA